MAKKNEAPPEKTGVFRNITNLVQITYSIDKQLPIWLGIGVLLPLAVFTTLAIVTKQWFTFVPFAVLVPVIAFLLIVSRRADSAGFKQVEGKPGASGAILNTLKVNGLSFEEQPVAIDAKTFDLVFRGVGRAGVFLIAEGPVTRVRSIVEKERKRISRVLPNIPIIIIYVGDNEGQTTLRKLKSKVVKSKTKLTKLELDQVKKRLHALGTMRLPIPKGVDPNRVARGKGGQQRSLRGLKNSES